jgi:phosphatidylglycerophosphatase A
MSTIEIHGDNDRTLRPTFMFLLSHPAHFIAMGFGSGMFPVVPGTMGTLFGWASYAVLNWLWPDVFTPLAWGVIIVLGFFVGVWACGRTGRDIHKPDHGCMVWDEIIAMWLVLLFVMPVGWSGQLAAFLLFRAFDMIKPPPIRYFDQRLKNGFGVMLDDILAAFFTLLVVAIWRVVVG